MNCHTCERELNQAVDRLASKIKEDLNFQQACAAIGRGECVEEDCTGAITGPLGNWEQGKWDTIDGTILGNGGFRIVPDPSKQVEPPPSLTYAQALECEKVRIYNNPETKYPLVYEKEFGSWDIFNKIVFDFAERRGYRMEKVD